MTYCVAISVDAGLCFISDSRTNAGVDNVSTYSKMHKFGNDADRQIVLLSAGNLATTQGVVGQIKKDINQGAQRNLMNFQHLEDVADYVGEVNIAQQEKHTGGGASYEASFIVGGQISGHKHGAYLVYPQGNHITTSADTPFLQIGESKYGKPILDRIITLQSSLETAAVCGLVSMDSTMRSNITVGPPVEVLIYETDSLVLTRHYRFDESSEYLRQISKSWDARLKEAFASMPPIAWSDNWDKQAEQSGTP
ncbi:MAG TPA: peptidase [Pseudomonadales bacterium]|nr:peptidase [Pseudomonadales bacterium]